MQVKVRKLSEVKAELTITNTVQEVEEAYQAAYKSAQKDLRLPGFRKGKAPMEMLEKHLGERIVNEAMNELLEQNLKKCMDTLEPAAATLPAMKVKNFDRKKGATFIGPYELFAKIIPGKYKKVEVSEDWPKVDPESIQKKLEAMQKSRVNSYPREEGAQMKDIIGLNLSIRHNNESLLQIENKQILLDEEHTLPGIPQEILGMKAEEEKNFQLTMTEDFRDSKYAGKELDIHVKLLRCSYEELPPLDDEFARDCGDFESLEELKAGIRSKLLKEGKKALEKDLKYKIVAKIVSESEVILPEHQIQETAEGLLQSFFGNAIKNAPKKPLSIAEVARLINEKPEKLQTALHERSKHMLSELFVLQKIAELQGISVEEKDLAQAISKQLGTSSIADVDMRAYMEVLMEKDRKTARAIYREAHFEKTVDWLHANAKIKRGKEVSISKLIEDEVLDKSVLDGVL